LQYQFYALWRFGEARTGFCVRKTTGTYDNNLGYFAFTPVASDVLIAAVDFTNDTVTSLEGTNTTEIGIAKGYVSGDLKFFANRFGGVTNPDEFEVEGTHFVRNETVSAGTLGWGVAAQEAATGTGYLMYSQESVHTRFAPNGPNVPQNADHFICVRYNNGQWEYDNNVSYFSFTPLASDVLVAEVDFTNDTVRPLVGVGIENPWMYTGRELDAETGLYQYRNRFYHAHLGRFTGRDTIEYIGGDYNLYGLLSGSPLASTDPFGLRRIDWTRDELDKKIEQRFGPLLPDEAQQLDRGCIGLCALIQGRRCIEPPVVFPEEKPRTECYKTETEAVNAGKTECGDKAFVFAKQSEWKGGIEPNPDPQDGTVPNDSLDNRGGYYNYVCRFKNRTGNTRYCWMNQHAGIPGQTITFSDLPTDDPAYPDEIWCYTCPKP
jgi:RHS repeat-associated protein